MPQLTLMKELPQVIAGPNNTICVNPATFHELVAFSDAVKAGILCFVLGILFWEGLNQLRQYLDKRKKDA